MAARSTPFGLKMDCGTFWSARNNGARRAAPRERGVVELIAEGREKQGFHHFTRFVNSITAGFFVLADHGCTQ